MIGYFQMIMSDTVAELPAAAPQGQFAFCKDAGIFFSCDGNGNWMPSSRTIVKKSTVQINAKNTGNILIYTLEPSTFNFFPAMTIARVINVSGVTTPPTISVGTNATSYNNISSSSLLSSVLATLTSSGGVPQNASVSPALVGGSQIFANVSIGAIATNYTISIDILGYYQ